MGVGSASKTHSNNDEGPKVSAIVLLLIPTAFSPPTMSVTIGAWVVPTLLLCLQRSDFLSPNGFLTSYLAHPQLLYPQAGLTTGTPSLSLTPTVVRCLRGTSSRLPVDATGWIPGVSTAKGVKLCACIDTLLLP